MEPSSNSTDGDTDSDTKSSEVLFKGRGGPRRLELACVPRVDILQRGSEAMLPVNKQLRIGYDLPKQPAEYTNRIAGVRRLPDKSSFRSELTEPVATTPRVRSFETLSCIEDIRCL